MGKPASKKQRIGASRAGAERGTTRAQGEGKVRKKKPSLPTATLKKFREILMAYKERITGDFLNLRQSHLHSSQRESTGDLSGYALHMADLGTDTFEREFALALASSEQDILYRIDQALRRIEEKTYGFCETCDRPIKLGRLKAVPWARLCIKCKEIEEKGGGDT
jgi:RNA polymerase-binding protein DksA